MDAKTCERCGMEYMPGVIDACPSCGAPAGRIGGSSDTAPVDEPAEAAPPPASSEPWAASRRGGGGGAGLTAWLGTLVLVVIAAGAVWYAFGGGGGAEGDVVPTAGTSASASVPATETAATQTLPTTTTTSPATTSPATTPASGRAPLVKLAPVRAQDRGCLARWNARRNRAVRRKAFAAATGGRRIGAVQLVPPGQPTAPLHCIVLVGVQPRAAASATPGRIYAEVRPFTAAPSRWIRLGTAFLTYQWNARMRAGGRLDAARR